MRQQIIGLTFVFIFFLSMNMIIPLTMINPSLTELCLCLPHIVYINTVLLPCLMMQYCITLYNHILFSLIVLYHIFPILLYSVGYHFVYLQPEVQSSSLNFHGDHTIFKFFGLLCQISGPENRQIFVYHWMIVIWLTQRQTPTLVGIALSYQSRGSYFDLADNIESVMMFSVENPLSSDCGPCLLVLFRCINLTAERSGLLLPLFSIN